MRLIDRFLNRSNQSVDRPADSRIETEKSIGQQVWDAPALFNRKTRRAYGILSKVWRWDTNVEGMRRTFVPRYVRRHFKAEIIAIPKTRRQRRHRARIRRAMGWVA